MFLTILMFPALVMLHASMAGAFLGVLYTFSIASPLTTVLAAILAMGNTAFANSTPNFICSWKPTPGSPELGGYECES